MDLALAEHQAHERFINHIMPCRKCHSPVKRYCSEGKALLVNYLANYLMGHDLYTRRTHLARMEATDPGIIDDLKARMIAIHEQTKERADEEVGI